MFNVKTATADDLAARAALLAGEIEANEQENEIFQVELNGVYAEIDTRRSTPQPKE